MANRTIDITVADAFQQNQNLNELVQASNEELSSYLVDSHVGVRAEWSLASDGNGKKTIRLSLEDFAGRVEAGFSPEELQNPQSRSTRLNKIWRDLLRIRTNKLLERLYQD